MFVIMLSIAPVSLQKVNASSHDVVEAADLLAVEEPLEIRLGYNEAENRQQKSISVNREEKILVRKR